MKTSELTDAALDWAVAKCEKSINDHFVIQWEQGHRNYSSDWSQGGPIIEREHIGITRGGAYAEHFWKATRNSINAYGQTPLVAAMRAYVASKMGDEVEIPKELTV